MGTIGHSSRRPDHGKRQRAVAVRCKVEDDDRPGFVAGTQGGHRPAPGPDSPDVVYEYAPERGGKHGEKLLKGFEGTVQMDRWAGRTGREER